MDAHIRYPEDPGPLLPYATGGKRLRFRWPAPGDPRPAKLRRRVQGGGTGMYLLRPPAALEAEGGGNGFCLVEAYYPDQFEEHYFGRIDPWRQEDWRMGRLVALNTGWWKAPSVFQERLHNLDLILTEVRRNNRQSRRDLKRKSHEPYIRQELDRREQAREDEVLDEYADRIAARGAEAITRAKFPQVSVPDTLH